MKNTPSSKTILFRFTMINKGEIIIIIMLFSLNLDILVLMFKVFYYCSPPSTADSRRLIKYIITIIITIII